MKQHTKKQIIANEKAKELILTKLEQACDIVNKEMERQQAKEHYDNNPYYRHSEAPSFEDIY